MPVSQPHHQSALAGIKYKMWEKGEWWNKTKVKKIEKKEIQSVSTNDPRCPIEA